MNLLDLPDIMLEQIFEFLSYDEIAKNRLVSPDFDRVCKSLLNRGFLKICRAHVHNMKKIRSQLPRRESERRNHHLARHADLLQCIETRLSMLTMTYSKYIDANVCCFIPGKIIDEVTRLLKVVENTSQQLRAREILQELRDLTSMSIEHFDEKIAPNLKKKYIENAKMQYSLKGPSSLAMIFNAMTGPPKLGHDSSSTALPCNTSAATTEQNSGDFLNIFQLNSRLKKEIKTTERLRSFQLRQIKMMRIQSNQIVEMRGQIAELRRRVEETDAKNREISLNISLMKEQKDVAAGSSSNIDSGRGFLRSTRKPNIKPRTATIILKRCIEEFSDRKGGIDPKVHKSGP